MFREHEIWRPGSFTKNFSWGKENNGMRRLYESIQIGFNGKCENVERDEFRSRLKVRGYIDHIPANFFLFNFILDKTSFILADELVYQALKLPYSNDFDCIALGAFHASFSGKWQGQQNGLDQPALWARGYIREIISKKHDWNIKKATAIEISKYLDSKNNYKAKGSTKVSTNLAYLYKIANSYPFGKKEVTRCWVSIIFLMLDRLKKAGHVHASAIDQVNAIKNLTNIGALDVFGPDSLEKRLALKHILDLHFYCGGVKRFDEIELVDFARTILAQDETYLPNDDEPLIAFHHSNIRINKIIPKICKTLSEKAGFMTLLIQDFSENEAKAITERLTQQAINRFKESDFGQDINLTELLEEMRRK